ncbi:hypothetical protein Trydic_g12902 [Trypoxylus dichotomus]
MWPPDWDNKRYILTVLDDYAHFTTVFLIKVPYTPQLNGKAERLNQTLAERIRSLIDSELEKNMWGEAAFVVTYLLNRSPTAGMNVTPSERWYAETRNTDTPRKEIGLRWPINDAHYEENKNASETLDENSIEQDQENDENLIQDNEENSQKVEEPMQSKRSERTKKLPKYLEEYELDVENISCMTYEEVVTGQNRHECLQAIEKDKKSLIENNTWEEVLRMKNDGRYKARLVLCGNQQEYGIDFTETYSPVVDVYCLRIILAVAAARNYTTFGFDIKTAFLYGELEETTKICELKKSLYGLKQAPLKWNELFTSFLRKNGLKALETQRFIFKNDDGTLILAIYVDDGILIGNNVNQMNELLSKLGYAFKIKIDKNLKTFGGIDRMGDDSKPVETPIAGITKIADDEHDELRFPYREIVGSLLYASCKTRPDLAYANTLSGSTCGGIKYVSGADTELLEAFCDSDFAGCEDTSGPIAWCSRRQPIVSLSQKLNS